MISVNFTIKSLNKRLESRYYQGPAQWFIRAKYMLLTAELIHSNRTHSCCQRAKIFIARKI